MNEMTTTTNNQALTKRLGTVRELADRYKGLMAKVLPQHMTADRMLRVFLTAVQRDTKLLACSPMSLVACMVRAAELGLEPNTGLGLSYLVPYKGVCTLIPGYRGLVQLAIQSGAVQQVRARMVHEGDRFLYEYGLDEKLVHVPSTTPGKLTHVYSVARFVEATAAPDFDVMTRVDVDKIRTRSKAATSGPWTTDYDAMAAKTVVRRHTKALPASTDPRYAEGRQRLEGAMAVDEREASGRHFASALVVTGDASAEILNDMEAAGQAPEEEPSEDGQEPAGDPAARESVPNVPADRPPVAQPGQQTLGAVDPPKEESAKAPRKSLEEQRLENRATVDQTIVTVQEYEDLAELEAWAGGWKKSKERSALPPALRQEVDKALDQQRAKLRAAGAQEEPGASG